MIILLTSASLLYLYRKSSNIFNVLVSWKKEMTLKIMRISTVAIFLNSSDLSISLLKQTIVDSTISLSLFFTKTSYRFFLKMWIHYFHDYHQYLTLRFSLSPLLHSQHSEVIPRYFMYSIMYKTYAVHRDNICKHSYLLFNVSLKFDNWEWKRFSQNTSGFVFISLSNFSSCSELVLLKSLV